MTGTTREETRLEAASRRNRILNYLQQDPPVPLTNIAAMEGMAERACRAIIKEIEAESGFEYRGAGTRRDNAELPFGLSSSTHRLRSHLAGELYSFREKGNRGKPFTRNQLAPLIGLNTRQQIRAENKPFTHDWTLSEIERLARELGRDPLEFLLTCLTT
jgi:hypothetical protein